MPTSSELKGFDNIGEDTYSDILRANLISFIDWGLINKGAFFNVTIATSGIYGGTNKHILKPVKDNNYSEYQVYQAFRGNWVWQSGLQVATQPIQVSGVYVNGSFYPLNTSGTYAHHVDYPNGRIVFDNSISSSDVVTAEYSYKWVQVADDRDYPFERMIQYDSLRTDNRDFTLYSSGSYDQIFETRPQLPLITIDISEKSSYKGYQIGNGSYVYKDVKCCIYSENDRIHTKLADILSFQKEKTILLYDTNEIARQQRSPLDINGSIASGALTYPQMVEPSGNGGFLLQHNCTGSVYFKNAESFGGESLNQNLYYSIVKYQTESILTNI